MHLLSIPRHQIETTIADYARIAASLLDRTDRLRPITDFERRFANYVGCRHAIAISSGRLGLHLLLEALGFAPGDEVIVPAFNLFAVVERFCQVGMIPRFCDVRRDDLNLDPIAAEKLVTPRTKAILATHMFGHPANMTTLTDLARRHNLVLLEDCAHALGSTSGSKMVGTFGRASIFSFSVLKLVTTFGGGMITTHDSALAGAVRLRLEELRADRPRGKTLRKVLTGAVMDLGTRRLPFSLGAWPALRVARWLRPGFQKRLMTEQPHEDRRFDPRCVPPFHPFQARLGRSQLARVDEFIRRRRQVSEWLDGELSGVKNLALLSVDENGRRNGLYYGILADRADELNEFLFRRGIDGETSEYLNCADLPMYRESVVDCPVARDVQSRILRLPNYPKMTRRDVRRIGDAVRGFYV